MSEILIQNGVIVQENQYLNADVLIRDDKIVSVDTNILCDQAFKIDAEGCYLTPGLIDIHIHGGLGCDFLESNQKLLDNLMIDLLHRGVTAILPTVMTEEYDVMIRQIDYFQQIKDFNILSVLGINVEGPFLSPLRKGVHRHDLLQTPDKKLLEKYINDFTKIVTISPELDEDFTCIKELKNRGIIASIGHSNADYDTTMKAVEAGASLVTHLYNTMRPFHHRDPGIITASLLNDSLFVEIIADGVHVHPAALELAIKCKPANKIILISDCIALRDSSKNVLIGGKKVFVSENASLNEDGVISGSITTLEKEIQNLVNWGLCDFKTAIQYATSNPASLLGLKDLGHLKPDYQADVVLWDKETLAPKKVIVKGNIHSL